MSDTSAQTLPPPAEPAGRKHGRNAFMFIIITVLIDMIGFGMVIPVFPFLLSDITGLSVSEVAPYGGALTAVYGIMNFLAGPVLGNLSDRFGRRPVLLISLGTLAIDFVIMGLAHSLWLLFVGRIMAGISGATIATASAYIADVTEPAERGRAFGMIGAAFGVGFIIGPVIGGLLGQIDPRAPFFAAAALAVCNMAYGWFVLPESLPTQDRRAFNWRRANPLGAFRHFSRLPRVVWLLAAFGIYALAHWVYPAVWSYHGGVRYGWSSDQIGLSLGFVGVGAAIIQGVLVGPFIRRFGARLTVYIGFTVASMSYLLFAAAFLPWMVYVIIPFSALSGLTQPAMNHLMTAEVDRSAQGELQGATASLNSLTQIIAVLGMTQVFHAFTSEDAPIRFAGAPFILAAIITLIAFVPLTIGLRRLHAAPAANSGH